MIYKIALKKFFSILVQCIPTISKIKLVETLFPVLNVETSHVDKIRK